MKTLTMFIAAALFSTAFCGDYDFDDLDGKFAYSYPYYVVNVAEGVPNTLAAATVTGDVQRVWPLSLPDGLERWSLASDNGSTDVFWCWDPAVTNQNNRPNLRAGSAPWAFRMIEGIG